MDSFFVKTDSPDNREQNSLRVSCQISSDKYSKDSEARYA